MKKTLSYISLFMFIVGFLIALSGGENVELLKLLTGLLISSFGALGIIAFGQGSKNKKATTGTGIPSDGKRKILSFK